MQLGEIDTDHINHNADVISKALGISDAEYSRVKRTVNAIEANPPETNSQAILILAQEFKGAALLYAVLALGVKIGEGRAIRSLLPPTVVPFFEGGAKPTYV